MSDLSRLFTFILRFSTEVRNSRLLISLAIFFGVVAGASSVALIALINRILEQGIGSSPRTLIWAFAALCVILPVFRFLSDLSLVGISERAQYDLRRFLCRRILTAPLAQLEKVGTARLLATLTDDVGVIIGAMAGLPTLIMQLAILVSGLVYLYILSWQIFLAALVFLVVGVAGYRWPIAKAEGYFRKQRQAWDVLFGHFKGLTAGIKELKLHGRRRHSFVTELFEPAADERMHYRIKGMSVYAAARAWGQVMLFVLFGVLLFVLPALLGEVDESAFIGSILVLLYLLTPIEVLLGALPQLGQAGAVVRQAEELGVMLGETSEQHDLDRPTVESSSWSSIELRGVVYTYFHEDRDEQFQLGPIDLTFHPGELVYLVGGNGSGKTTLAKILLGLYVPEAGEIVWDGEVVGDHNRERYRQLFSAVFADFYLFEELLGLDSPQLDEHARHYIETLHLDKKVEVRDGRLSTLELSQGQRKRLALLTAYLEDRPIYLFDEWAADQDPVFKEIFYRILLPALKKRGKTSVVISHDDRYYSLGDRMIKLENGQTSGVPTATRNLK